MVKKRTTTKNTKRAKGKDTKVKKRPTVTKKKASAKTPGADRPAPPVDPAHRADAEAFTESLIAHGQAAKVGPDGKLPSGATHELVTDKDGTTRAVRRRFSIL